MAARQRSELEFTVIYSIHMESMMSTLLRRIEKLFSFLQVFLGVAVVSQLAPTFVGLLIAAIASAQLVWQPGIKAMEAKASRERWLDLFNSYSGMDDACLEQQIAQISKSDSMAYSSLVPSAHLSATVKLGLQITNVTDMTLWQRLLTFASGGMASKKNERG